MKEAQFDAVISAIYIIEEQMKQPLNLDEVSKQVGLSKYYLHRLFKSITGKNLSAYVRGRRLSTSLNELSNTSLHIIDISNEYQFEHEQSYIRAFKQQFHITPAQYRKQPVEVPIEQRIDISQLSNIGQGLLIEPEMIRKTGFFIQGIEQKHIHELNYTNDTTNHQALEFQKNYFPLIKDKVDENVYIGYVRYSDNPTYGNYYTTGTEVTGNFVAEPPMITVAIPTHDYAVFRYVGLHSPYEITFATLLDLYNHINKWKQSTTYKQAAPYHFERIDLTICGDSYCEMDIYVPIE